MEKIKGRGFWLTWGGDVTGKRALSLRFRSKLEVVVDELEVWVVEKWLRKVP